jgi:hypothetical protein
MFLAALTGPPYDLKIEQVGLAHDLFVSVPVARHSDDLRTVFVETSLCHARVDDFLYGEVSFQIRVIALDDSFEPFETQDPLIAKEYFPIGTKTRILDVVRESAILLVNSTFYAGIYLVAKETGLPPKAMIKYYLLVDAMERCGYSVVEQGSDAAGREFWKMRRVARVVKP